MRKFLILFLFASSLLLTNCSTENTPIYSLTTDVNPSGAGTVSPSSGEYDEGTEVDVMAISNEHWVFKGWDGDYSGNQNPASILMDTEKSITAQFIKREYPLSISVEGEGIVREEVIHQKTMDYPHGTVVQLTANPAEGWEFIEWRGDVEGTENIIDIEVDREIRVTALFQPINFLLTIEVEGNGHVEEEIVPFKNSEHSFGTNVQLTANPDEGWRFSKWGGGLEGDENPQMILIQEKTSITAVFEQNKFTIDLSVDGNGEININPNKDFYLHGEEIEITVEPKRGWNFVHWQGDFQGIDNPMHIIVDKNIKVTAILDNSPFDGGDGSEEYPYMVSTIDQLQEVRNHPNKNFIQITDIDATKTKNWNGGKGFIPIGDDILYFDGSFDGGGFEIKNLFINRPDENSIGLFGYMRNGSLFNVGLRNAKVSGNIYVGGLVGENRGEISFSYSIAEVDGASYIGGLVGYSHNGEIKDSFSDGIVIGGRGITFTGNYIGGLIGLNQWGPVKRSYSISNVTGKERVGGLVGDITGLRGFITDSYALGKVTGENEVGGLVGTNRGDAQIRNSFSAGSVNGKRQSGGFVGLNGGVTESNFWNTETSRLSQGVGRGISDGVKGLNTSQITGESAVDNMPDFDWQTVWKTTSGYPILRWQGE